MSAQLDLFTDHEAVEVLRDRVQAMLDDLKSDCCTGDPLTTETSRPAVRCGRCGTVVFAYAMMTDHDSGYMGCPVDVDPVYGHLARTPYLPWPDHYAGRLQLRASSTLQRRHDRTHYPNCAGCNCAWGLHADVHMGALPAGKSCLAYCGCPGYVPPPHAEGPTGRCPGCWADPHDGRCDIPARKAAA